MLGADPHRPSRESAPPSSSHFPPPPSTAPVPSPTYEPMRTPVSPRSSTGLTHLGYSPYKRPLTPDRFPPPVRQGPRGHRANSAGSTATTIFGSPDRSRHPTMRTPQPEPYQSLSRPLEVAHNSGRFGQGPYDARPTEGSPSATHQPSSNDARYAPHPGHYIAFGRSPNDAQATAPSPIGPLGRERVHNGMEGHPPHENGSSYQAQMDLQDGARPMHEHSQILRYEPDASDPRAAFKPALDHNPDGSLTVDKHRSMGSSQTSGDAFHHNGNLHRPNPFNANTEYSASLDLQPNPRQGPTLLNGTTPDAYTRPPVDDSSLQNRQPTPPPRGHLHVGADALGRRNGRISPLPQAVQGAQSQLSGPGGEPGIKSEFGRMFSGIGSGVGSAKSAGGSMGSGTPGHDRGQGGKESTPKKDGGEGLAFPAAASGNAADEVDATGHRAPSRVGGRKGKKVKAEEARVDSESGDGRATPGNAATRPLKKGKHGHHHHHHAHQ
ncbi:MAG: hypothetical protein M1817_002569 [Caeruleum heppii]|nr:MAG: hypothetical protein M1817_002569 [Caeruleum heppii]